jgi:hypothetical protein
LRCSQQVSRFQHATTTWQAHNSGLKRRGYRQRLSQIGFANRNRAFHDDLPVDGQEKEAMHSETQRPHQVRGNLARAISGRTNSGKEQSE